MTPPPSISRFFKQRSAAAGSLSSSSSTLVTGASTSDGLADADSKMWMMQLKQEAADDDPANADAKMRITQLKQEEHAAAAAQPRRFNGGLFKAVYSTDLLFLMDTTSSMRKHIQAAKTQVKSIIKDITSAFLDEAEVRMSIVSYKDHADTPNIEFLDFTTDVSEVHGFLNNLTARAVGGGDIPEDVLGGIDQTLKASWKHQTRVVIHIADAPPHGRGALHDESATDHYPTAGTEPHGLVYEPLLKQMVSRKLNYALLRINNSTDRMALRFFEVYAEAGAEAGLHTKNRYLRQANEVKQALAKRSDSAHRQNKIGLLFQELELGTTYELIRGLIVNTVTSSASRTAVRLTDSLSKFGKAGSDGEPDLLSIAEDDDDTIVGDDDKADDADATPVELEITKPQWDTPGWLDETLVVEGFSPRVVVHGPQTLNDMMQSDDAIKMSVSELTIRRRSRPFAQGAMRLAAYARTDASNSCYVVKSSKRGGEQLAHLAQDMRCQAFCKAFALEFNSMVSRDGGGDLHTLDFIVTTCLKGTGGKGKGKSGSACMSLEPFIEGDYVKYNNNCGYVNTDLPADHAPNRAAQAFSHFTYERSRGRFLVCDLQGVGSRLTDPAIHTLDPARFSLTDANLGLEGFKFFFATHECSFLCKRLGLVSTAPRGNSVDTIMWTAAYNPSAAATRFRTEWPAIENTVCCSNKFCGRILPVAGARRSDRFAGHSWCEACFPQLQWSTVTRVCEDPASEIHDFDVSRFFYESQGRVVPKVCGGHEKAEVVEVGASRTEPEIFEGGGSFWGRLKGRRR